MKSVSIWAVALAATMSVACDNRNINDDTAAAEHRPPPLQTGLPAQHRRPAHLDRSRPHLETRAHPRRWRARAMPTTIGHSSRRWARQHRRSEAGSAGRRAGVERAGQTVRPPDGERPSESERRAETDRVEDGGAAAGRPRCQASGALRSLVEAEGAGIRPGVHEGDGRRPPGSAGGARAAGRQQRTRRRHGSAARVRRTRQWAGGRRTRCPTSASTSSRRSRSRRSCRSEMSGRRAERARSVPAESERREAPSA